MKNDPMIASLLHERAGYERMNRPDRAALVTAELEKLGYEEPDEKPQGRSTKPVETAEGETAKRGPGRPRKPRDEEGNIIRDE